MRRPSKFCNLLKNKTYNPARKASPGPAGSFKSDSRIISGRSVDGKSNTLPSIKPIHAPDGAMVPSKRGSGPEAGFAGVRGWTSTSRPLYGR